MLNLVREIIGCKRKSHGTDEPALKKRIKDCLVCELCKDLVVASRTLPCGDSFCDMCINEHLLTNLVNDIQTCPVCNAECKKITPYPCFLLDEIVRSEEKGAYDARFECNKLQKERNKLSDAVEGMKIDVKDTEGIWCEGTVKNVMNIEKSKILLVHFDRWDSFYDELIPLDSERLAPEGTFTKRNILRYKLLLAEGNKQAEVVKLPQFNYL